MRHEGKNIPWNAKRAPSSYKGMCEGHILGMEDFWRFNLVFIASFIFVILMSIFNTGRDIKGAD